MLIGAVTQSVGTYYTHCSNKRGSSAALIGFSCYYTSFSHVIRSLIFLRAPYAFDPSSLTINEPVPTPIRWNLPLCSHLTHDNIINSCLIYKCAKQSTFCALTTITPRYTLHLHNIHLTPQGASCPAIAHRSQGSTDGSVCSGLTYRSIPGAIFSATDMITIASHFIGYDCFFIHEEKLNLPEFFYVKRYFRC